MEISILNGEYWWGGIVNNGSDMPYSSASNVKINMMPADQGAFIFLSSKGRYIYSANKYDIEFRNGYIYISGDSNDIEFEENLGSLKGAHLALAKKHFKLDGKVPNPEFFEIPQYNTWIELMYNQNEKQILEYAKGIIDNDMIPGILMIDEGWSISYGEFDFYSGRFQDPIGMVKKLHDWGFKVMLWVTPIISPDSNVYRQLRNTNYLLTDKFGNLSIKKWWNGYSCVLDLSNPYACEWLRNKLFNCMKKYDVDGFKFDAGDAYFYEEEDHYYAPVKPLEMTSLYNNFGSEFEFNEFRSAWNVSGRPIVCRLQDKFHIWDKEGINCIIPNMLMQGLIGCYYGCPDMIGGGAYSCFTGDFELDSELYIRWIQASVYFPMIQFSIAPWRVLNKVDYNTVKKFARLHMDIGPTTINLAKNAALSGEPIVRSMEYEFPGQGFETVNDQFMYGSDMLIAPVVEKGKITRDVKLPDGIWKDTNGVIYKGGQIITVDAPIEFLPVFIKYDN